MCRSCGEKLECENCAISLTYHKGGDERSLNGEARVGQRLECHYCGFRRGVPSACPKCASEHLYYLGAGSQQGEERLAELFPGARIGRMDRDTVRSRGDMERLLSRLHSGEINLLVGTQMIAKGHDIHGVTLVGVVGADFALGLPDFRAAERVFQLLTQVSGRAGRGELPGKVLVQTYQPDHYVNQFAREHDYTGFAAREMYFRRGMRYPPFSVLANVIVQSEQLEEVLDWCTRIGRWVQSRKFDRGAGAGAGGCAELAAEADLPVSPGVEVGPAGCAAGRAAGDAGDGGSGGDSAEECGGGCGPDALDVSRENREKRIERVVSVSDCDREPSSCSYFLGVAAVRMVAITALPGAVVGSSMVKWPPSMGTRVMVSPLAVAAAL